MIYWHYDKNNQEVWVQGSLQHDKTGLNVQMLLIEYHSLYGTCLRLNLWSSDHITSIEEVNHLNEIGTNENSNLV